MQELILRKWDDVLFAEGQKVEADETVGLTYRREGRVTNVELDLTADNIGELESVLGKYLRRGHDPGAPPSEPGRTLTEGRAYTRRLRSFAKAHDLPIRPKTGKSGGYYYSRELKDRFAAWEREHGEWKVTD